MDYNNISQYTVKELKEELQRLRLPYTGLKDEFIERLLSSRTLVTSAFPTGIREIDEEIMLNMNYQDITSACTANKQLSTICKDNYFWQRKLSKFLDYDFKDPDYNYREIYEKNKVCKTKRHVGDCGIAWQC
jgi:hypothetical protein